jgi:hypothetical protein
MTIVNKKVKKIIMITINLMDKIKIIHSINV